MRILSKRAHYLQHKSSPFYDLKRIITDYHIIYLHKREMQLTFKEIQQHDKEEIDNKSKMCLFTCLYKAIYIN